MVVDERLGWKLQLGHCAVDFGLMPVMRLPCHWVVSQLVRTIPFQGISITTLSFQSLLQPCEIVTFPPLSPFFVLAITLSRSIRSNR